MAKRKYNKTLDLLKSEFDEPKVKRVGVPEWLHTVEAGSLTVKQYEKLHRKKQPAKRKLPRFLTVNEVFKMLKVAPTVYPPIEKDYYEGVKPEHRNEVIILLTFFCGLRNSELRLLEIHDIDFEKQKIKVFGKGRKERYVPVPAKVLEKVKLYIGERTTGLVVLGQGLERQITKRHIARIVKKCAEMGGVRNWQEIHPHTLRHSYATFLRDNGRELDEIRILLGHENIETTVIYAHLGTAKLFSKTLQTLETAEKLLT